MKLGGTPLRAEFLEKKLKPVLEAMEERGIDMWLTFTREGNECARAPAWAGETLFQDAMRRPNQRCPGQTWSTGSSG